MEETNRPAGINRRDVIGLLTVTPTLVSSPVLANTFGAAAQAASTAFADRARHRKLAASSAQHLARLAAEHFEPLVGDTFTIGEDKVTLSGVRRGHRSRYRDQFAVVFSAPRNASVPLEPLSVSHPAIGQHDLLVTEVLDGGGRTALEICFG